MIMRVCGDARHVYSIAKPEIRARVPVDFLKVVEDLMALID